MQNFEKNGGLYSEKAYSLYIKIIKKTEEICIVSTMKSCVNRHPCVSWGGDHIYIYIYIHIYIYVYPRHPPPRLTGGLPVHPFSWWAQSFQSPTFSSCVQTYPHKLPSVSRICRKDNQGKLVTTPYKPPGKSKPTRNTVKLLGAENDAKSESLNRIS